MAIKRCNSLYLTSLSVVEMMPNIRIIPISKAPLKQTVPEVVGSDSQKYPIAYSMLLSANESMLTFTRTF
jgi:hypothetical protein